MLAAGASMRLGRPKQLLPWRGRSLLRYVAETALSLSNSEDDDIDVTLVAVLGSEPNRFRSELDGLPAIIAMNSVWEEGQASSLRTGVAALEDIVPPVDAALVLLCDQPFVTPETLQRLLDTFYSGDTPAVAAMSVYETGASGPPCLFARRLFPELLALRGAQRAKDVLSRYPAAAVRSVSFPEGSRDIDTPEDWERLFR